MWTCKRTSGGSLEFFCDGAPASTSQVQAYFATMSSENNHLRLEVESLKSQVAKFKKGARSHYENELFKINAQSCLE